MKNDNMIDTGHEGLNRILGGGVPQGSTNLIIEEDWECRGDIFLGFLMNRWLENNNTVVVDCFSISPRKFEENLSEYEIQISNYESIYLLDFTSPDCRLSKILNEKTISKFPQEYLNTITKIKVKNNVFNPVLSLSGFVMKLGEEQTYTHLISYLDSYQSWNRTAFYLVHGWLHSMEFIGKLKTICDTVIVLNENKQHEKFVYVDKSVTGEKTGPIRYYFKGEFIGPTGGW